jgi:xylulokinase
MDVTTGEYIKEILDYLEIKESQLPMLHESGEIVGEYKGIKIASSAIDQIAGVTGAGVTTTGCISETTGTSLAVSALTDKLPPYFEGLKVSAYYVRKGLLCLLMWAPTAGATLEWFKKTFLTGMEFPEINKLALEAGFGAEGVICLPHLCGTVMPENNAKVKGAFFGITLKHDKGHFIRAIMESVAYTIKEYVDYIGVSVEEIRSMGGGAKSDLWCNIKSQVLDKKIVTLKENETACLGSAIFAGVGIKVFDNVNGACENLINKNKTYKSQNAEYGKIYKEYKIKEKKLLEIF